MDQPTKWILSFSVINFFFLLIIIIVIILAGYYGYYIYKDYKRISGNVKSVVAKAKVIKEKTVDNIKSIRDRIEKIRESKPLTPIKEATKKAITPIKEATKKALTPIKEAINKDITTPIKQALKPFRNTLKNKPPRRLLTRK